ncbi:MAG: hypothetical protein NTX11_03520 [Candidatus Saccharibacteria bacterium]|nr:hypothetical protein [Candidatus Saccharibacteria bacterium]
MQLNVADEIYGHCSELTPPPESPLLKDAMSNMIATRIDGILYESDDSIVDLNILETGILCSGQIIRFLTELKEADFIDLKK